MSTRRSGSRCGCPRDVVAVSESGLKSREELDHLAAAGYRAFLIGERFMTDPDPAGAVRRLMGTATGLRGESDDVGRSVLQK